jgi:hypothetical protein
MTTTAVDLKILDARMADFLPAHMPRRAVPGWICAPA